jgi:hypothetical protein
MTMRQLTELQIAALACVRDNLVIPTTETIGWRTFRKQRVRPDIPVRLSPKHRRGFDVTSQIRSFRKRRLLQIRERKYEGTVYTLTPAGFAELEKHPEF